jgi:MFS family permease
MSSYCTKYLAQSLLLSLGSLDFGYALGHPSGAIPEMKRDWGEDATTESLWTMFNSIMAIGAIFGPFLVRLLLTPRFPFGRQKTVFISALLGIVAWLILLGHSKSAFWVGLLARFLLGIAVGGLSGLIPMYVVEIVPPSQTGFFGSLPQLFCATAFIPCYLFSEWMSWKWSAGVGAIILGALACLVWLLPDSPVAHEQQQTEGDDQTIVSRDYIAPILMGIALMCFQQLSGINAILTNMTELFQDAGVDLSAGYASTITAVAQPISTLFAGPLIQKLGRKFIWNASFGMIALSEFLFAISQWPGVSEKFPPWLPIVFVFLNLLGFGLGAGPIPWFMASELFPDAVRSGGVAIISTGNWILSFAVMQVFPPLLDAIKLHGVMLLFGCVSTVAVLFGAVYVRTPEALEERLEQAKDMRDSGE